MSMAVNIKMSEDYILYQEERLPPYAVTATINEPGLGLLSWWN